MNVKQAAEVYLRGDKIRRQSWEEGVYVYLTDGKQTVKPEIEYTGDHDREVLYKSVYLSPLESIEKHGVNYDETKTWERYRTPEQIVEDETPYIVKIKRQLDAIDDRDISDLEKDILYIHKACEAVSFDSVYHDWITFNTKEPKCQVEGFPLYIKIWNQHGSSWGPMKQHHEWDDDIRYYAGGGASLEMNKEDKTLWSKEISSNIFELNYEEITREEYVNYFRKMAQKTVERRFEEGIKPHRLADDVTSDELRRMY